MKFNVPERLDIMLLLSLMNLKRLLTEVCVRSTMYTGSIHC